MERGGETPPVASGAPRRVAPSAEGAAAAGGIDGGLAGVIDTCVQYVCRPKVMSMLVFAYLAMAAVEQQREAAAARPAHLVQRDLEESAVDPKEMQRRRNTVLRPMLNKRSAVGADVFVTPRDHITEDDQAVGMLSFAFGTLSAGKRAPPSLALDIDVDDYLRGNGSLWLHLRTRDLSKPYLTSTVTHRLMKHTPPRATRAKKLLGGGSGDASSARAGSDEAAPTCTSSGDDTGADSACAAPAVVEGGEPAAPWTTHFQNKVTFAVLEELDMVLKLSQLPALVTDRMTIDWENKLYHPVVWENSLWREATDYTVVNASTESLNLTIDLQGMGLVKYSLYQSFEQNKEMGLIGHTEVELLKGSPYVLGAIVVVSVLHSVFNILAFKNDISFWRQQTNMKGQSMTVLVGRFAMQLVILLYLMDSEGTSKVVIYNFGLGVLVDAWKIVRAVRLANEQGGAGSGDAEVDAGSVLQRVVGWPAAAVGAVRTQHATACAEFADVCAFVRGARGSGTAAVADTPPSPSSSSLTATVTADQQAARWLFILACPILLAYSIYSLVEHEHKSAYSFVLHTLVRFIYWFGFAMMTPQLFINYKLKSVAHMPWRAFVYKAIGTFIDDMFAFAIEMPTAHRLSCLRDDFIFLIFVYQYYVYKVDHTRVNEFGQIGLMGLSLEELRAEQAKCEEAAAGCPDARDRLRDIMECITRKERAAQGLSQAAVLAPPKEAVESAVADEMVAPAADTAAAAAPAGTAAEFHDLDKLVAEQDAAPADDVPEHEVEDDAPEAASDEDSGSEEENGAGGDDDDEVTDDDFDKIMPEDLS